MIHPFCCQVVAAVDGKLLSIFDGKTEYRLGRKLLPKRGTPGKVPLDCCYFSWSTEREVGYIPQSPLKPMRAAVVATVIAFQGTLRLRELRNCSFQNGQRSITSAHYHLRALLPSLLAGVSEGQLGK